jgi:REP element-mobilizing transposase RayT
MVHGYFLTYCTVNRARLFASARPIDLLIAQILRAKRECAFAEPAYCFMPDHVHLLVEGKAPSTDGRDFIKRSRLRKSVRNEPQRYGYDHVLRDDEKAVVIARYMLNNPIRAGLAKRIEGEALREVRLKPDPTVDPAGYRLTITGSIDDAGMRTSPAS